MFCIALFFTFSTESTNPPTPCADSCQNIPTNTSVTVIPTPPYTTTLRHDVGPTDTNTIIPTTTTSVPLQDFPSQISASKIVSSAWASSSNTLPQDIRPTDNSAISTRAAYISTTAIIQGDTRADPTTSSVVVSPQLESDKLTSSIKHQSITQTVVEQSNPISNMQSILTPSLVLEENNLPKSTSTLNMGAIIGIAAATAFLLGLSLIIIMFIAYRKWWRHDAQGRASKGKYKNDITVC